MYKIKDLYCKYPKNKQAVLEIKDLSVEKNSIVFFIGVSGAGKSTLLETLGLMNNTLHEPHNSIYLFNNGSREEDIVSVWRKSESKIAKFRGENFSFIFQNTNLLPTLSAFQNILSASLLNGSSKEDAMQNARTVIGGILEDLNEDRNITELSGGQKQRVSFARAIATDVPVLFADEPTGNLDWANASILMNMLIDNIRANGKTAIIVSHDLNLAVEYADKIVYIDRRKHDNTDLYYGAITKEFTFEKTNDGNWSNTKDRYTDEQFLLFLKDKLKKNADIQKYLCKSHILA